MADFRAWTVDGMEGNHYEWTWTAPEDAQSGVWTMVIRSLTDEPQVDPLVLFDPNPENAKERIEERRQYDEDRLDSVLNARQYVITFHITP
jgi:thymidylate kinase